MLWPGKITVYLHDTIETKGLRKEDVPALRDRVRAIICAPVEGALKSAEPSEAKAGGNKSKSENAVRAKA